MVTRRIAGITVRIAPMCMLALAIFATACAESGTEPPRQGNPRMTYASSDTTPEQNCSEFQCRTPDPGERMELDDRIRQLRDDDMDCYTFKHWLLNQLWSNFLLMADAPSYRGVAYWGAYGAGARVYMWSGTLGSPGETLRTLGHEAAHHFYGHDEDQAENLGLRCAS